MPLTRPTDQMDKKVSERSSFTWPVGAYRGTIEEVHSREFPDWAGDNPNNGWESEDGEILSIQIGQLEAVDVEETDVNIGNRKFFPPEMPNSPGLTVRDGPLTVEDVDPTDGDAAHWKLQRAYDYLMRLAKTLNQVQTLNGNVVADEDFVTRLRNGAFNGREIGFELFHDRTYERDGNEVHVRKVDDFYEV